MFASVDVKRLAECDFDAFFELAEDDGGRPAGDGGCDLGGIGEGELEGLEGELAGGEGEGGGVFGLGIRAEGSGGV